jgi:hypothetical protein
MAQGLVSMRPGDSLPSLTTRNLWVRQLRYPNLYLYLDTATFYKQGCRVLRIHITEQDFGSGPKYMCVSFYGRARPDPTTKFFMYLLLAQDSAAIHYSAVFMAHLRDTSMRYSRAGFLHKSDLWLGD